MEFGPNWRRRPVASLLVSPAVVFVPILASDPSLDINVPVASDVRR